MPPEPTLGRRTTSREEEAWDSIEFQGAHTFGVAPGGPAGRVVATVLFSDVVGSTAMLEQLGDHLWTEILDEHHTRIRAAIDRGARDRPELKGLTGARSVYALERDGRRRLTVA